MDAMATTTGTPPRELISGELWQRLAPLIPLAVHGRTGRPRCDNRAVLEGIVFVLSAGIGWTKLPPELGYGPS